MVNYTCMYTRSQKGIKMRMETTVGLYGKGNEIISWCSLCVGLCLVLNGNCCYMCCHHQSMLHQIYMSQISNDNICQGTKIVSSDDNIHLFSCVGGEKVRNLSLYVSSTLQCDSCNSISKHIMNYNVLTPAWAM